MSEGKKRERGEYTQPPRVNPGEGLYLRAARCVAFDARVAPALPPTICAEPFSYGRVVLVNDTRIAEFRFIQHPLGMRRISYLRRDWPAAIASIPRRRPDRSIARWALSAFRSPAIYRLMAFDGRWRVTEHVWLIDCHR